MQLFGAYIKSRRGVIFAFLLFTAIFAVSFALYRLPLKAVLYPAALCAVSGAAFIIADWTRVRHRHAKLTEIHDLISAATAELPPPRDVESADYRALIEALQADAGGLEMAAERRYQDMIEYYTVWAHQIKTPIASMRLALQDEDSPLSRRLSSDLFRIEQYVEMVLTYLRLDSPSSDYVFKTHSIDGIVRQAVRKFAPEFIGRKIRLEYEGADGEIVTDDKWLSFVIEQVLSNALKYTREGGCIRIYMTEPKTLCIEDNGIGIAPEDLPRIFEKGYTGYNGRADRRASGIGLYLCKRICENLGVGISVSSGLGRGTAVSLDLTQHGDGGEVLTKT